MSIWNLGPEDWFRRFFGRGRGGFEPFSSSGNDLPKQFDEMRILTERMFEEQLKDLESNAPKDLVREYKTSDGTKVREVGPLVYGYSMTIGPDGKPVVREFGNVKPPHTLGAGTVTKPIISGEREPLVDVITSDNEVKVTVEMPGVTKENIKISAYDNSVEVKSEDPQRKYHRVIEIPPEADIETVKSSCKNGILEIIFKKKEQTKPKGKDVKVE
jgi:HSP20 family protein